MSFLFQERTVTKHLFPALISSTLGLGLIVISSIPAVRAADAPVATTALVESDVAFLKKGLSKKPGVKEVNTLKATAMMLALYAQNDMAGPDAAKAAGRRDQALLIAAAMDKKDYAAAKAAVEGLATAKEGDPKKTIKLHEQHAFDLSELMAQFSMGRVGGRHIEADLKTQAAKVTDVKLAAELAGRVTTIGQYTAEMPASDAVGPKKKKWDDLSKEMIKLGVDASAEAAKGDKADKAVLGKKLAAINLNCKTCHDVFRNN